MKSTQLKKNNFLNKSIIAGVIGFFSWFSLFIIFFPLAGYYKFKETYAPELLGLLVNPLMYIESLFVGIIFFFFFYLTLKNKENKLAKIIMWLGIVGYALFYLGYLFLLFFFTFKDL